MQEFSDNLYILRHVVLIAWIDCYYSQQQTTTHLLP